MQPLQLFLVRQPEDADENIDELIRLIMGVEWLVPSSRDEQRGSQAGQWALPGGHTTMYYTYHHTTMYCT